MPIKDVKLINMVYLTMCEWLYKVHKYGVLIPSENKHGDVTYNRSKLHSSFNGFCNVMRAVVLTGASGKVYEVTIASLFALIKKVYALSDDDANDLICGFFDEMKYNEFIQTVVFTEQAFKWTDNFQDWEYL